MDLPLHIERLNAFVHNRLSSHARDPFLRQILLGCDFLRKILLVQFLLKIGMKLLHSLFDRLLASLLLEMRVYLTHHLYQTR